MVFHPAIMALYLASLLISLMTLYAAYYGVQILRKWDIKSGSDLQLILERRTYLISTILTYVFVFEIISFFLYIYTADQLHTLFVGAMCAAGTLKVNSFGYPALIFKMVSFIMAGLWLILNYMDNRGFDYPLIKKKYLLLLIITPFILTEAYLQGRYFLLLRPNIITSCCGSLFSSGNGTLDRRYRRPAAASHGGGLFSEHAGQCGGRILFLSEKQGRLSLWRPERGPFHHLHYRHPLLHLPLLLRAPNSPLPVLHIAGGVWIHRLSPLRRTIRQRGDRDGRGDTDAVSEYQEPCGNASFFSEEISPRFPDLVPYLYGGRYVPNALYGLRTAELGERLAVSLGYLGYEHDNSMNSITPCLTQSLSRFYLYLEIKAFFPLRVR